MYDVRCEVLTVRLVENSNLPIYTASYPRRLESLCIWYVLGVKY